jgi:hypothetical protein
MTYSHSGTFSYGQQIAWTIKLIYTGTNEPMLETKTIFE